MDYFFEVWDNDAINGSKSTRSTVMRHKTPSEDEQKELTEKNNRSLKDEMEETLKIAEEVQQEMNELNRQLIEEKSCDGRTNKKPNPCWINNRNFKKRFLLYSNNKHKISLKKIASKTG